MVSSFLLRGLYRNGGSKFISMALVKTTGWVGRYHFRTLCKIQPFPSNNSNSFFIYIFCSTGFCRNSTSKFISMAPVKINPQNDLGDITSELCVKFNPFPSNNSNLLLHSCWEGCTGMAGLSSYLWSLWRPQDELGDITSEPCVEFNRCRVINQIVFFIFAQRVV